jgi:hypothetical protein
MQQKSSLRDTFFALNPSRQRPVSSVATEFMEDWEMDHLEDDEIISEAEDGDNSPRLSLNSVSSLLYALALYPPPYSSVI